jgi:hypothetical protein
MARIPQTRISKEGAELTRRLVTCLPAATFEMETFCRLAGIEVSDRVPTAAVECTLRPRLLLNPEFTNKYCQDDEHLFLLVMHELWHIILAHTRMYPRATLAHNIAFDAIINAGLSRQFSGPEYRGFFKKLNPMDDFPQILLRPPEGWPDNPVYPANVGPEGTLSILARLYPPQNKSDVKPPFYDEILELLQQYAEENGLTGWGEIILIGNHDDGGNDGVALDDPIMKEIMKKVVKRWPKGHMGGRKDRGSGGDSEDLLTELQGSAEHARRAFSNVLKRCVNPGNSQQRRKAKRFVPGMSSINVLPNARDRTAPAKRILGAPTTLWGQPGFTRARVPDVPSKAFIYLDVSGSMGEVLPRLLTLITPYARKGLAEVYQFSTTVEPLPYDRLKTGYVRTTGGTNINCVMQHIMENTPKIRRVLILTDGFTGEPNDSLKTRLQEQRLYIHVVVPAEESSTEDLESIATTMTVLPSIYPGSRW